MARFGRAILARLTAIYGHRGARGEAPENTIAGFLHAQSAGVAGIETDIAVTADFCPVLHHDPALPDGRLIRDLPRAELPGLPTLAQALTAVKETDWLLEIKTFPDDSYKSHKPEIMVPAVLAALDASKVAPGRIRILAFEWRVLDLIRARAPFLRLVCLTAPPQEAARNIWWGRGYDDLTTPRAVARFGATIWSPLHKTLTLNQIAEARALGLRIVPWTVNDPEDFARLAPLVDGITTDYPGRFRPMRQTPSRPADP
jgi:glycerophosphoryl diester phosphodiesterase